MAPNDDFADVYNPSGYIKSLIDQGIGPTEGLRTFRFDDGGQIQDSRWFQLYGEVNGMLGRQPSMLGVDQTSVPSADLFGSFEAGAGGQYVTTVELQIIDRGTGLWYTQQVQYWSDSPHTPQEAQDAMLDAWADPDAQDQYEQTVMGANAVAFWQTTEFSGT